MYHVNLQELQSTIKVAQPKKKKATDTSVVNVLSHSFQCLLFELFAKHIVGARASLSALAVCIYSEARQEEMLEPLLRPGLHYGNVCGLFCPYPAAVNTCLSLYTNFTLHH